MDNFFKNKKGKNIGTKSDKPRKNNKRLLSDSSDFNTPKSKCRNFNLVSTPDLNLSNLPIINRAISPIPFCHDLSDKAQLKNWNLPEHILDWYLRSHVEKMFDWQVECLTMDGVLDGGNLVFSAPTSAGKTLVADILMLQTIFNRGKKVLIVLPFVSVSREKMVNLQGMFKSRNRRQKVRVGGFMGSYHTPGGLEAVDVAICTIEKANILINRLIEDDQLDKLGLIVIDELHMLGDLSRGYLVEFLITKILHVSKLRNKQIQIVGMSATIPNLQVIASWLNAQCYITDFRPIPLKEKIKIGNIINEIIIKKDGSKGIKQLELFSNKFEIVDDEDGTISLALETIMDGNGVLIFCPSKNKCEILGRKLALIIKSLGSDLNNQFSSKLRNSLKQELVVTAVERLKMCAVKPDNTLIDMVKFGVAFHHASLTIEEKEIIEDSFRLGYIKVVVATSTLSSGVNLPARRVLIRSPKFMDNTMEYLTYKQMAGRAGRKNVDSEGECIVICKESEASNGKDLVKSDLKPLKSSLELNLKQKEIFKRLIVEGIAIGTVTSTSDVLDYLSNTFSYFVSNTIDDSLVKNILENLTEENFLCSKNNDSEGLIPTKLARASMVSALSPSDCLELFAQLEKARKNLNLSNDIHLLYHVTPTYLTRQINNLSWEIYSNIWNQLDSEIKSIGELIGVKESIIFNGQTFSHEHLKRKLGEETIAIYYRFYATLALNDLIQEKSLSEVSRDYNLSKGLLQSFQLQTGKFAGMVTRFCGSLGWKNLEVLFNQFQNRIYFGVERELIDLVKLPSLNASIARNLFKNGYATLASLTQASKVDIECILRASIPFEKDSRDNIFIPEIGKITFQELAENIVEEAKIVFEKETGIKIFNDKTVQTGNFDNITAISEFKVKPAVGDIPLDSTKLSQVQTKSVNFGETSLNLSTSFLLDEDANELDIPFENYFKSPLVESGSSDISDDSSSISESVSDKDELLLLDHNEVKPIQSSEDKLLSASNMRLSWFQSSLSDLENTHNNSNKRCDNQEHDEQPEPKKLNLEISNSSITDLKEKTSDKTLLTFIELNDETMESFKEKLEINKTFSLSLTFAQNETSIIGSKFISTKSQSRIGLPTFLLLSGKAIIESVAISFGTSEIYYISNEDNFIKFNEFIAKKIESKEKYEIICFDVKEVSNVFSHYIHNFNDNEFVDLKICLWLLNPENKEPENIEDVIMDGYNQFSEIIVEVKDSWKLGLCAVWPLYHISNILIKKLIENDLFVVMKNIEIPVLLILGRVERLGFGVNLSKLKELSAELNDLKETLLTASYTSAGQTFNIKSSRELARTLYGQLNLNLNLNENGCKKIAFGKRLPKNLRMTQATLERLKKFHELPGLIQEIRKVKVAYKNCLIPCIKYCFKDQSTSMTRVSGEISPWTSTGRIYMKDPNLLGIMRDFMVRDKLISVREAFIPRNNYVLISADYCQLELRILAHFSEDEALLSTLNGDGDVFKNLASLLYNKPLEVVNDSERQHAKAISYGVIYGMGVNELAKKLDSSAKEASSFQESFFNTFPKINDFIISVIADCKKYGFTQTLHGRKRFLPNINCSNTSAENKASRQSVNTKIQGSAADIIKEAMIKISQNVEVNNLNAFLILQLHDELIYEVKQDELNQFSKLLSESMNLSEKLKVHLPVKMKMGTNWSNMIEHIIQ